MAFPPRNVCDANEFRRKTDEELRGYVNRYESLSFFRKLLPSNYDAATEADMARDILAKRKKIARLESQISI